MNGILAILGFRLLVAGWEMLKYRLVGAGLGKSRQVEASRHQQQILKYTLVGVGLGRSRQV